MISTKGRYALRMLCDLAEQDPNEYVPLKDIAARQEVSLKYLESIVSILSKNSLIEGVHGKGGGYRLTKKPGEYRVGEILRLTETSISPVACVGENSKPCSRASSCKTYPMWSKLNRMINEYVDSISIEDLL